LEGVIVALDRELLPDCIVLTNDVMSVVQALVSGIVVHFALAYSATARVAFSRVVIS
jgi:hypothetical protein